MRHLLLLPLAAAAVCLTSCSTPTQVKDPVESYKNTRVIQYKNGLLVLGDWDYIDTARAANPPRWVIGGLAARIVGGKPRYEHYCITRLWNVQASDMQLTPEDYDHKMKKHGYDRATLERAARGAGLVVPLPHLRRSQSQAFSPAYVRGFLLKVDKAAKHPGAHGVKGKAVTARP